VTGWRPTIIDRRRTRDLVHHIVVIQVAIVVVQVGILCLQTTVLCDSEVILLACGHVAGAQGTRNSGGQVFGVLL
jgi:hypothetical protein